MEEYAGVCTPEFNRLLGDFSGYSLCPSGSACGSPLDHKLSLVDDGILSNSGIQYGISSFDNMGQAFIAVFQIITNDSWSVILYNLQRWYSIPAIPAVYCLTLIFMGTFFLLNLMLAVVMESYMESEILTAKEFADD